MAAGSGDTASKYVARRETPLYIPENCTQCMECIAVCPDTALPNCSQDFDTVLRTAISNYVEDPSERNKMLGLVPEIDRRTRELMRDSVAKSTGTPLQTLIRQVTHEVNGFSDSAKTQFFTPRRFRWRTEDERDLATTEKRSPAAAASSPSSGRPCKGCAACVTACGEHQACGWSGERSERGARERTRSSTCCRIRPRSTWGCTTTRGRRTRRRRRCATC